MNNYVTYHLHTDCSLLDSCTSYQDYIDKAVELGQSAICFTEHGNVYNWIEKKEACDKKGIKYIHGVEMYLTQTLSENIRDNFHTILIAKNEDGIKEINRLIDLSTTTEDVAHLINTVPHFYFKNRISFEEFLNISDNVIKISACLASPLNRLRKDGNTDILDKLLKAYDFYEVQPHNCNEQKEYNQWLYEMSVRYNKPLIAGTDTHALDKYKAECRNILRLYKGFKYDNEDSFDLTYKSYLELCEMFKVQNVLPEDVYLTAIENTNIMADMVEEFEIDRSLKYPILYGDKDESVFKARINKMYKNKVENGVIKKNPIYIKNLREEMRVFKKTNMIGFMLFMSEMIEWCWNNGIPIGFCRGSVGGSTTAYITDIIDVDPVVWNTVFSRFCNEDRAGSEIGDIDIDISPSQRHLVQQYIVNRFGYDNTAFILTTGTLAGLSVIDTVGGALAKKYKDSKDNPYSLANVGNIKKEWKDDSEDARKKYPELFYYYDGLVGTKVSQSFHPAGVIASPITLNDNYGTFWAKGKRVLQINMEECHTLQLAKYDCLALRNLEIIKDTCQFAGIPFPKSHQIDWDDKAVWEDMITSPVGLFQFEGKYAFDLLKKYKPQIITHMSTVNAALRPSGESYRDRLIAREKNKNPSLIIDELLKDNEGYLVFQEDIIKFLVEICGLSGGEADNVRRAIARKNMDRLQESLPRIIEGYCTKSDKPRQVAEEEVKVFLKIIEDASSYMFGYNHSTGYSMLGYLCAYLRYYYPVEFVSAYLNNADTATRLSSGLQLAKEKGIKMLPHKFGYSGAKYTPDTETRSVYKGIGSIKYLNDKSGDISIAQKGKKFNSFFEAVRLFPDTRTKKILITLGFFDMFGKSGKLMKALELEEKVKANIKKENCVYNTEILSKYCKETEKMFKVLDRDGLLNELFDQIEDVELSVQERIACEEEMTSDITYINPKAKGIYYVCSIDTKYTPRLHLYALESGEYVDVKMSKKDFCFQGEPVVKAKDIMACTTKPRNKSKMVDGKWIKTDEKELYIDKFRVKSF